MARLSLRLWHLLLVGMVLTPLLHCAGPSLAAAQPADDVDIEDELMEEDEDDMEVSDEEEDEEPVRVQDTGERDGEEGLEEDDEDDEDYEDEEEEEEEEEIGPHPDAETIIIFTNRPTSEFVAGELVNSLIGFTNKGDEDFIVTTIEASFRYPQDFNYYIQNFSRLHPDTYITPNTEVAFVYDFRPNEAFYARAFGLVMNIFYKDTEDNEYRSTVYNGTVNIVEVEEGFDVETFFTYVFMVSGLCLLMFIVHFVYTTVRKGGRTSTKKPIETGTQGKGDIDYQWLPPEALPKKSPKPSPRNKKGNRK